MDAVVSNVIAYGQTSGQDRQWSAIIINKRSSSLLAEIFIAFDVHTISSLVYYRMYALLSVLINKI